MIRISRKRTLLGVLLFIPLAIVLLVTFACLPAPVGDPDQSSINDKFTGAWQLVPDAGSNEHGLVIVRPWDKHTSFLQYLPINKKDTGVEARSMNYKSWLTTFGDATFITCESLDNKDFMTADSPSDRYYWVAKLELKDDTVTVTPIKDDAPLFKDAKTREQIEQILKANLNNNEIYGKSLTFKKLTKDELEMVDEARKAAYVGLESNSNTQPAAK